MSDALTRRAKAMLILREREEQARLASRYDWYGPPCECGLPIGQCKEHPRARENQRPPDGDWRVFYVSAGRGFGKTRTGAEFVRWKVETGQWKNIALVGETVKDVRDVMIEGPAGLLKISPPWFTPDYEPSKARVTWPNGVVATSYSAEQPDQLRGPQHDGVWCDELAKWKHRQQETWDNLEFGLRLGDKPQCIVTTTPQPTPTVKMLLRDKGTVVTGGSTYENAAHLAASFLERIREKYEGTRLGRQELHAALLDDTPGALWTTEMIDNARVKEVPKNVSLVRVVVGVDPGAGSGDPESGAETGIVVAGKGSDGHGYVLADCSVKGSPDEWAAAAVKAYHKHLASWLCAEANNGGDMVEAVIRTKDRNVAYEKLWASRGKVTRAEPVAALYEQGKVHHVGGFPQLETQMCEWVPGMTSPDRMDALVWALTRAVLGPGSTCAMIVGETYTIPTVFNPSGIGTPG